MDTAAQRISNVNEEMRLLANELRVAREMAAETKPLIVLATGVQE